MHFGPCTYFTPSAACLSGTLYTFPTWDPSCLSPDTAKVNIHLIASWYEGESTEIYSWLGIENKAGDVGKVQKQVMLMPKWWNATAEVRPASAQTDLSTSTKTAMEGTTKPLSGGKIAAAIIILLLIVAGLCYYAYMFWQHKKSAEQSKRFSITVDKCMSTISTDWKSMSAAGASAAICNSIAINRDSSAFSFGAICNSIAINRDSSAFSFGAICPSSTYAIEVKKTDVYTTPTMKQVRIGTGVGLRHPPGAAAFAAE
ncbi:hypothetical protein H0H87_003254, partial [Tephrocybe sp. NHM501043]